MADDFENVDIPSMADDNSTTLAPPTMPSRFARVLFQSVPEAYAAGTDVTCRYLVTAALTPTNRDWIGVFRIGWRTPADYIQYTWAAPGITEGAQAEVQFVGNRLPADDGDFYQFCYVTRDGQVGGASTPFQFIRPSAGGGAGFVALDDDEDAGLVVVTSRITALEADLKRAAAREDQFSHDKRILEKECDRLLDKMADCDSQLKAVVVERDQLEVALENCQKQVSEMETATVNLTAEKAQLSKLVDDLRQEVGSLTERLSEKETEIGVLRDQHKTLVSENDRLRGEVRTLVEQKNLVETHASTSDDKTAAYQREVADLRHQIMDQSVLCAAHHKQTLQLRDDAQRDAAIIKTCKADIQLLTDQLRNAEDKLVAAEHSKRLCGDEVSAVQEAHTKMALDFEKATSTIHELKDKLRLCEERNEREKCDLGTVLEEAQKQLEESHKESSLLEIRLEQLSVPSQTPAVSEAALHALREAHTSLREHYVTAKRQRAECARQVDQLIQEKMALEEREKELRREVADLQERLLMGEDHYKQTFVECVQMKRELRKMRKQVTKTTVGEASSTQKGTVADASSTTEAVATSDRALATEKIATVETSSSMERAPMADKAQCTDTQAASPEKHATVDDGEQVSALRCLLARQTKELDKAAETAERYCQLYTSERKRSAYRQHHYLQELRQRDAAAMGTTTCQQLRDVCALNQIIEDQRAEIQQLKIQQQMTPQSTHTPICLQPMAATKTILPRPEDDEEDINVDALGDAPLTPLPPPIQPTVLPSAKAAAVKAIYTGLSQSETTTESETGETEVKSTLDDSTARDPCGLADESGVTTDEATCPVCSESLGGGLSEAQVWQHVETHYGPECPVCQRCFPTTHSTAEFLQHVEDHFGDE